MSTHIGSGLRRRQLARILTELRAASGKDQIAAAAALDCSRPTISNYERGVYVPSRLELPALLECYGALDRLPALEELRAAANEPGWWSVYGLPTWLQAYVRLETDATNVQCFDLELVPGLLQVEGYARGLLNLHRAAGEDTERRVAVLTERQRRIGNGLALTAVISEGLLHRTANMGPMGTAQLRGISTAMDQGSVELRVLPFAVGIHRSMSGSFSLLQFPSGTVDPVAYQEHAVGGHLTDDQEMVGRLGVLYNDLWLMSLDREGSARVVAEFVTESEKREVQ